MARWWKVALCLAGLIAGVALARVVPSSKASARLHGEEAYEDTAPDPSPPSTAPPSPPRHTTEISAPVDRDPLGERFRDGMLITGSTPHRLILFTFDDGPHRRHTPRMLEALEKTNTRAVFFMVGTHLVGSSPRQRTHQRIARQVLESGHLIGNHTLEHLQLPLLNDAQTQLQIDEAEKALTRVLGERTWLFRHPGGARSSRIDRIIASRGYTSMLWNLGTGDVRLTTAEDVFSTWKRVFERREREYGDKGGIVLLHDTYPWSVEAYRLIHAHLMAENCRLLETGEELFDILDDPGLFFVPRADADPSEQAPQASPYPDVLKKRQAKLRQQTVERCAANPE